MILDEGVRPDGVLRPVLRFDKLTNRRVEGLVLSPVEGLIGESRRFSTYTEHTAKCEPLLAVAYAGKETAGKKDGRSTFR